MFQKRALFRKAEKTVWVSFDMNLNKEVQKLRFCLGHEPVQEWNIWEPWPKDLDFAISECWTFMADPEDQMIWEVLMHDNFAWPSPYLWIVTQALSGLN